MPPNSKESTEKCTGLEGALASEGPGNMEDGSSKQTGVLFEADVETNDGALAASTVEFKRAEKRKLELVWRNIILFAYVHLAALYGAYLMFTQAKLATTIFGKDFNTIMLSFSLTVFAAAAALYICGMLGITGGAHRLWAHRSYKAKWPLRLILIVFNTIAFQDAAYHWARDHRVHHKFSETDADPHNATRGFFFSHVGWLLTKKHPDVKAKGKILDLSDLHADPILMFQKK